MQILRGTIQIFSTCCSLTYLTSDLCNLPHKILNNRVGEAAHVVNNEIYLVLQNKGYPGITAENNKRPCTFQVSAVPID